MPLPSGSIQLEKHSSNDHDHHTCVQDGLAQPPIANQLSNAHNHRSNEDPDEKILERANQ
jgi:hypothetical protein